MFRRLRGEPGPWTDDPILDIYRFTNAYRASDRVSQYLIGNILYADRPSETREIVFRTILFRLFNKPETWQVLEKEMGPLTSEQFDQDVAREALQDARDRGARIYSSAYIIPPVVGSSFSTKHGGHLELVANLLADGFPETVAGSRSLEDLYDALRTVPSLGPFLAFQLAIDLNYSTAFNFDEDDFVVAGPGAHDGISKCFVHARPDQARDIIELMRDRQEIEFDRLRLDFQDLGGRRLKSIDCQNLFCELSKYARVAHPEIKGLSGRTRIKQSFRPQSGALTLDYPPKWNLSFDDLPAISIRRDLFD